jgi:hypothetical protein
MARKFFVLCLELSNIAKSPWEIFKPTAHWFFIIELRCYYLSFGSIGIFKQLGAMDFADYPSLQAVLYPNETIILKSRSCFQPTRNQSPTVIMTQDQWSRKFYWFI